MKNKLILRIVLALLFVGVSSFIIFNENGLIKFLKMKEEIRRIDNEIEKAKRNLSRLESEIDSLQTSKEKLERVAREKFHMMKKSEKSFRVEEK